MLAVLQKCLFLITKKNQSILKIKWLHKKRKEKLWLPINLELAIKTFLAPLQQEKDLSKLRY